MSYRPLIIKSEFRTFVKLGANVGKDEEIEMFIRDMQELEFQPIVDDIFYTDVTADLSTRPELQAFLNSYIKPYLVCGSYEKFLLWQGRNVSQFGLRINNEESSVDVGDKARGELMADIRRKTNVYLNIMKRELYKANYTFDGVVYTFYDDCFKKEGKPEFGIKQVGRTRNYNNDYNRYRDGY